MRALYIAPIQLWLILRPTARAQTNTTNTVCGAAIPLQLDVVVQGNVRAGSGHAWYSITGTGENLTASTCTGNATLDTNGFDSYIYAYSGNCYNWIGSDDDGGSCGNSKSRFGWQSDVNEVYYIAISDLLSNGGSFGFRVSSIATPPPETPPPNATSHPILWRPVLCRPVLYRPVPRLQPSII